MAHRNPAACRGAVLEPLEVRRLMSVAVAPLFFPTPVGTVLHYQVSQAGAVVGTATRAVIGPATFNGTACTEVDEVMTASDGSVVETDKDYFGITADGVVQYGSADTETDATGAVTDSEITTYAPSLTKLPATVTAGVAVTNTATRTDVYTNTGRSDGSSTGNGTDAAGNPITTGSTGTTGPSGDNGSSGDAGNGGGSNTRTVTETDVFTLASETPQSLVVPAGTFSSYQVNEDDLTPESDGTQSNDGMQFFVSPNVGIVQAASVKVGGFSEVLTSIDGPLSVTPTPTPTPTPSPTPTTTPVLTPVAGPSTVPTTVVSGARTRASVAITVSNDGSKASKGPTTVKLYATTTGVIDADSVVVGTITRRTSLASGADATLSVPVKKLDLPPGVYTLLARTTTADGTMTDATDGPVVTVAAPYVALAATLSTPATATVGKSGAVTLTLSNTGTADAVGPAAITVTAVAADGSTVLITSQVKPVKVKAGGRPVVVRLKVKVPATLAAGTYTATASVTVGTNTVTATADNAVVVI